jgi:serine/tyrosine/threonine adenylyltransferase
MRSKLGLFTQEAEDTALINDLLDWMQRRSADFTNTFRTLTTGCVAADIVTDDADFDAWHQRLETRRMRQPQAVADAKDLMRRHNPAYIPRNHKVEEALEAATSRGDFSPMDRLLNVLATPYDHGRDLPMFSTPEVPQRRYQTFCGT